MDTTSGLQVHNSAAGRSLLEWAEANPYPECLFQQQSVRGLRGEESAALALWIDVLSCQGSSYPPSDNPGVTQAAQLASHRVEMSLPC